MALELVKETSMPLLTILLTLAAIGFVLFLIHKLIPMPEQIWNIILWVTVGILGLWIIGL
jgi:hypothetical protein